MFAGKGFTDSIASIIASLNGVLYKGTIDCSANPNYPAADAGHMYVVSVAGKIGGASGTDVVAGDSMICNTDGTAAGDEATVGTKWNIFEKNITVQPVTQGGTGIATITDHSVMVGSGTGAVTPISVGATGEILCGSTGADPAFSATPSGLTSLGVTTLKADHIQENTGSHGVVIDNNVEVGSAAAGKNETIYATRTPIFTFDEANINEDDATWTMTGTGPLVHVTGNATTVTLTTTEAIEVGRTYKVTIAGTGGGATASYSLGGVSGTTIAASGTIAISDYITAANTGALIITPSSTCTVSITSIAIEKLPDATGDLTVEGNLNVKSPATFNGGISIGHSPWIMKQLRDATYGTNNLNISNGTYSVGLQIGSDGTLSIRNAAGNEFGKLSINGINAYSAISILTDTAASSLLTLGASYDVKLYRDAANILAMRNTTSQQTIRVYNTADAAGTFTNYERLSITGVQGASVNITAETAGTGGDNLDVVITPAGTGAVKPGEGFGFARATPVTHAATEAATAATLYGTTHLVSGAYTVTLPAVAVGMHGRFYATTAAVFSVDCNGADHFVLSGTALTAGYKVTSDGSVGAMFEWECTAANTITIYFSNVTFIDGGA